MWIIAANNCDCMVCFHACISTMHIPLCVFRYNSLLQQRTKLDDLEKALKEEQEKMCLEKEQHRMTAAECRRLRDEKDW